MKKFKKYTLFLLSFLSLLPVVAKADLLLFGGDNHDEFLGCLNCSSFHSDSICNDIGRYGSSLSSESIFNHFYKFGNDFSISSPWNAYSVSNSVPVLVDRNGNFYGYFTINDSRVNAVGFSNYLKNVFRQENGNLEKIQKIVCEEFSKL